MTPSARALVVLRSRAFALLALAAISFASGYRLYAIAAPQPPPREPGVLWPDGRALTPFDLVDHDGHPFGLDRLRGHWTLLVLGYSSCPDFCPSVLATLHAARERLDAGREAGAGVGVVFVSVDPERDTPQRLREYVGFFDARFVAVTGPHERLRALVAQLGGHYHASPADPNGAYPVEHTTSIAVVDPRARLVALLPAPHDAARIAGAIATMRDGSRESSG